MENLNGTITSAVPENPLFGANSAMAFIQTELRQILYRVARYFFTVNTVYKILGTAHL